MLFSCYQSRWLPPVLPAHQPFNYSVIQSSPKSWVGYLLAHSPTPFCSLARSLERSWAYGKLDFYGLNALIFKQKRNRCQSDAQLWHSGPGEPDRPSTFLFNILWWTYDFFFKLRIEIDKWINIHYKCKWYWVNQKKVLHKSEEKLHEKMKMT